MAWLGTNSNSLRGSDNLFKCGELDHWPFDLQITLLFIYATRKTSTKLELLRFSIVWVTSYKLFCVSTSRGSDLDRWAFGLKLQYNLHVHKYLCNNLNFLQLFVLEIRTYQECHMFLPPPHRELLGEIYAGRCSDSVTAADLTQRPPPVSHMFLSL